MSDHLLDEIANDLNNQGKPPGPPDKGDVGGIWVFLIALGFYLLWRYL